MYLCWLTFQCRTGIFCIVILEFHRWVKFRYILCFYLLLQRIENYMPSSGTSFLYATDLSDRKSECLFEGWDIVERPPFPPPPSQSEDVEHWTRAMFIDAKRKWFSRATNFCSLYASFLYNFLKFVDKNPLMDMCIHPTNMYFTHAALKFIL